MKTAFAFLFGIVVLCLIPRAQSVFVKTDNEGHFLLKGKPYYYIGANYWYGGLLAIITDSVAGKKRLRKELDLLHANGVNNLRVMGGVEGAGPVNGVKRVSPALQNPEGNFNENILKGLDYLLIELGKRNMKAVIYLSNNWEWTGGFLQYLNWNGLLPDSIFKRKLTWDENRDYVWQFYTCDACKKAYDEQAKYIVARTNSITHKPYKDDIAIMAWELANEPRPMRPEAIKSYMEWIADAAHLIKSMDGNHLVTTGSEGEMGSENMATFEAVHALKDIDYLTIHIWPKNWGWFRDTSIYKSFNTVITNTRAYINKHIAIANNLKKPLVIEEFGLPRNNHLFNTASGTRLRDLYYQEIFTLFNNSRISNGVIAGCNFWGFAGSGRASKTGNYWWSDGDDYTADPPPEEQGLNSVFDTDQSTWKIITSFTKLMPQ